MPRYGFAGVCLYWQEQCGEVVAYQYAHKQQGVGQNQCAAGQDTADKPFPYQRGVVSGGPPGLRVCTYLQVVTGLVLLISVPQIYVTIDIGIHLIMDNNILYILISCSIVQK